MSFCERMRLMVDKFKKPSQSKFKIGEIVKCNAQGFQQALWAIKKYDKDDDIYLIESISDTATYWVRSCTLEALPKETAPKFTIGQIVKCKSVWCRNGLWEVKEYNKETDGYCLIECTVTGFRYCTAEANLEALPKEPEKIIPNGTWVTCTYPGIKKDLKWMVEHYDNDIDKYWLRSPETGFGWPFEARYVQPAAPSVAVDTKPEEKIMCGTVIKEGSVVTIKGSTEKWEVISIHPLPRNSPRTQMVVKNMLTGVVEVVDSAVLQEGPRFMNRVEASVGFGCFDVYQYKNPRTDETTYIFPNKEELRQLLKEVARLDELLSKQTSNSPVHIPEETFFEYFKIRM